MIHKIKADTFFNEEERQRITKAIHDIETHTIGEVAVMVADSSDRYHETETMGGVVLGSLMSLIAAVAFFHSSIWWYISLSFLFLFPSKYLFQKIAVLKIAFIGMRRKEEAVMQKAVRTFYEKGLYKTKKNTGVLFFLSLLERKVWVLADKGIYAKIGQDTLNKFAATVSQGIKEGRACDSLCRAIEMSGELLAKHFPITPDDINELPDQVMTED